MIIEKIDLVKLNKILLNFNKCLIVGNNFKVNQISCVGNALRDSVFVYHHKELICEIDSALCFFVILQKHCEIDFDLKILIDTIIRDNAVFTNKINDICKVDFNNNQRLRMPKNANAKN